MTQVTRVQTGLRLDARLVKLLKALAEHLDMSVAELVECMALHAFEGKPAFSDETLVKIALLRQVYDMQMTVDDLPRPQKT